MRQRLRSLYEGLKQYLVGDDLWHALCVWQDNYADASTFELKEYLNQIAPLLPADTTRAQVHRSLVQCLLMNGKIAHFDPLPTMNEFRVKHGLVVPQMQQPVALPPHIAGFSQFYRAIAQGIGEQLGGHLHQRLVSMAESQGLSEEFQDYLVAIHADEPVCVYITDEPGMLVPLMDACYEMLCEWLGPVEADSRFTGALLESRRRESFELAALL